MSVRLRSTVLVPVALASMLLLGACATRGKRPVADLAVACTSVSQAEAAGAAQLAPVECLNARNKFASAEAAMRDEHYDDARVFTDEAATDADDASRAPSRRRPMPRRSATASC